MTALNHSMAETITIGQCDNNTMISQETVETVETVDVSELALDPMHSNEINLRLKLEVNRIKYVEDSNLYARKIQLMDKFKEKASNARLEARQFIAAQKKLRNEMHMHLEIMRNKVKVYLYVNMHIFVYTNYYLFM